MKSATEFGRFIRKLRIDNDESQDEMAKKLNVSKSFLSAVELGKKNIPKRFYQEIKAGYNLTGEKCILLSASISLSRPVIKIPTYSLDGKRTTIANLFKLSICELNDNQCKRIEEILLESEVSND